MAETRSRLVPVTEEALDVPWNVVVHNDPVNLMSYVTLRASAALRLLQKAG